MIRSATRCARYRGRYSPAPGVTVNAVAYNGSIPGPVLRVRNGQRIIVDYRNESRFAQPYIGMG